MKRNDLQDAMARRSPLVPREPVEPVDLYAPAADSPSTSGQIDNDTSGQTHKHESRQDGNPSSQNVDMSASGCPGSADGGRRRYTTYLRPETIKAIKWLAVDGERNDYEIVQEALDAYLRRARG